MKSNDLDNYKEQKQYKFTVTVDDEIDNVLYRYEFLLPDHACIYDLAKAIANKFDMKVPEFTTVHKPGNPGHDAKGRCTWRDSWWWNWRALSE